jgi:hypothetical protein
VVNRALMIAIAEVTVLIALDPVITVILMVTACNA